MDCKSASVPSKKGCHSEVSPTESAHLWPLLFNAPDEAISWKCQCGVLVIVLELRPSLGDWHYFSVWTTWHGCCRAKMGGGERVSRELDQLHRAPGREGGREETVHEILEKRVVIKIPTNATLQTSQCLGLILRLLRPFE